MIYRYKPYKEDGIYGITLFHKDEKQELITLGEVDGFTYVYAPTATVQDARLGWQEVVLDEALKNSLRQSFVFSNHKHFARTKIEAVGDVYDLVADAMKLIEFNMMLTARLAGDLWGTNPIDATKKAEYAERNKAFLDAVETGAITLRGDFEDMDTVMARLMGRVSTINELVRDHYVSELQKVGL